ncbi:MAG: hypothetical protein MI863_03665 [Desulfobacterales bacterium]|nr:hypothetical protein [Desulfobacterales bacterium]
MKYFPLKTAVLCLILPPILYALALNGLEAYLNTAYDRKISNILIGDPGPALEGSQTIDRLVSENISDFLSQDYLIKNAGVAISVFVTTHEDRVIYPSLSGTGEGGPDKTEARSPERIAKLNYDILNQGLDIRVEARLEHGTWIPNLILLFLLGIALAVFLPVYRSASRRVAQDRAQDRTLVKKLKAMGAKDKKGMARLKKEKKTLFKRLAKLEIRYVNHREKSKINEEEMFDEILLLEEERDNYAALKAEKEAEIEKLQSRIQKIERRKSGGIRRNEFDFLGKRFAAVYKQVDMNRKAISGFLSLNEDQQIKAEEVIHLLDRNPDQVTIKRKVFSGKKHKTSALEVLFAYNGRLYFHTLPNNRVEILVIGTKNSQARDMEFLQRM